MPLRAESPPRTRVLLAVLALCGGPAAWGQSTPPVLSIDTTLTGTDNGNQAPPGQQQGDALLAVRPELRWRRLGPGLDLSLDAGATARVSANGSQPDRVAPFLDLQSRATLVERVLTLQADAGLREVESDPYASRVDTTTGGNALRAGYLHLAPQLHVDLAGHGELLAGEDWSLAQRQGDLQGALVTDRRQVRAQTPARPFGVALEWDQEHTRFRGNASGGYDSDALRAEALAVLSPEFSGALLAGRERTSATLGEHTDTVYGARWHWIPGPRTDMAAQVEERFFGEAWNVRLQHRTPWFAGDVRVVREVLSNPLSLGVTTPGSGLGTFLDAMLTTRVPDPVERATIVDNLLTQRGLGRTQDYAIDVQADYAQLRNAINVGLSFTGSRDTLSFSAYRETLTSLQRPGDDPALLANALADSRQHGASIEANHRLTPVTSLDAVIRWSRIAGLAARAGDRSDDATAQISVVHQLSPRTTMSIGAQRRRYVTTVEGLSDFNASAAYVGLHHRF